MLTVRINGIMKRSIQPLIRILVPRVPTSVLRSVHSANPMAPQKDEENRSYQSRIFNNKNTPWINYSFSCSHEIQGQNTIGILLPSGARLADIIRSSIKYKKNILLLNTNPISENGNYINIQPLLSSEGIDTIISNKFLEKESKLAMPYGNILTDATLSSKTENRPNKIECIKNGTYGAERETLKVYNLPTQVSHLKKVILSIEQPIYFARIILSLINADKEIYIPSQGREIDIIYNNGNRELLYMTENLVGSHMSISRRTTTNRISPLVLKNESIPLNKRPYKLGIIATGAVESTKKTTDTAYTGAGSDISWKGESRSNRIVYPSDKSWLNSTQEEEKNTNENLLSHISRQLFPFRPSAAEDTASGKTNRGPIGNKPIWEDHRKKEQYESSSNIKSIKEALEFGSLWITDAISLECVIYSGNIINKPEAIIIIGDKKINDFSWEYIVQSFPEIPIYADSNVIHSQFIANNCDINIITNDVNQSITSFSKNKDNIIHFLESSILPNSSEIVGDFTPERFQLRRIYERDYIQSGKIFSKTTLITYGKKLPVHDNTEDRYPKIQNFATWKELTIN